MAKPVYALVGTDAFMQTQRLGEIMSLLPKDAQRIDVDGERAELSQVLDELRSFAMFGGAKVVVVGNGDDFITRFRDQLERYCEKPSDSATLVLRVESLPKNHRIARIIAKTGQIMECAPPADRAIVPWIINRGKAQHQVAVTPQAAEMLKELIGNDLGRLDNELAKLALQSTSGKIDVPEVSLSVAFAREQEMWHMTDEVATGHISQAIKRWRQLVQMDSTAEFRAVTWLAIWIEKAIKALNMRKRGTNPYQIATELKIWPAEKGAAFVKTAERMGSDGLFRALNLLVKVDYQSKTGVGDVVDNVERFLLAMGA